MVAGNLGPTWFAMAVELAAQSGVALFHAQIVDEEAVRAAERRVPARAGDGGDEEDS